MHHELPHQPWYILGAGSIGCLWAHHGRAAGREMKLILRDSQSLEQYRQRGGVSLVEAGTRHLAPGEGLLAEHIDTPIEQLLVCCKAHQTAGALASVAPHLADDCKLILLQNGMGVAEALGLSHPQLELYAAVSTEGAHRLAPFTVQRAGFGSTLLGLYPADPSGVSSGRLCRQLQFPGLELQPCRDIYTAQWQKLAVNAVINPLTAWYDINNGRLPNHPEAATLMVQMCGEIAAVSAAGGIDWPASEIQQSVQSVCQQTAANISSMLQDVRRQQATEIDYINGYLQQRARDVGVPDPINSVLLARIKSLAPADSARH